MSEILLTAMHMWIWIWLFFGSYQLGPNIFQSVMPFVTATSSSHHDIDITEPIPDDLDITAKVVSPFLHAK